MIAHWLVTDAGAQIPIRAAGIVIGRGARCDVVVDDAEVSRTQAILYAGDDGLSLVVLGSGRVAINGRDGSGALALRVGDRLELAGTGFTIAATEATGDPRSAWMLRDDGGTIVGVTRSPFAIGGAATADLRVDGWPDRVVVLHLGDRLHVEAVEPVALDDALLVPGAIEVLPIGVSLAFRERRFRVVAGGPSQDLATAPPRGVPDRVTLEFLPRGGRLTIGWGDRDACVYLPERRCELLALLLQGNGELVADEVVVARLWPGQARTRVDLNVVIHRARADLLRGGLDGTLIERATGGTATRIAVGAATRVAIR